MSDSDFYFDPDGDYKENTQEEIQPAWYLAMIDDVDVKKSKKGNDMIPVTLMIIQKDNPFFNRRLWEFLTMTDATAHFVKAFCKAVNPFMVSKRKDPINGFDPRDLDNVRMHLLGKVLAVRVELRSEKDLKGQLVKKARAVEFRFIGDNSATLSKLADWYGDQHRPPCKIERDSGVTPETPIDDDCPF